MKSMNTKGIDFTSAKEIHKSKDTAGKITCYPNNI